MNNKNFFPILHLFSFLLLFFVPLVFAQTCGDTRCDSGENSCTCPSDCGKCEGNVGGQTCKEYECKNNVCSISHIPNCCGNTMCEENEDYGNCPADCTPKNIEIEVLSPKESLFARGDEVLLKIRVTADGRSISSPALSAKGFFGELKFFNDGKHDDERAGDNVFSTFFSVTKDVPEGKQAILVNAEFAEVKSKRELELNIEPKLSIQTQALDEIVLGEVILISGKILKKESPSAADFEIKLFSNEQEIFSRNAATAPDGVFEAQYHSSLLDSVGSWRLEISASDTFENNGFFEKAISVKRPEKIDPLNIEIAKELEKEYAAGQNIDFIVRLVNDRQELVRGADVFLVLPDGKKLGLLEIEAGKYARSIGVTRELKDGFNSFYIEAKAAVNDVEVDAREQVVVNVKGFGLNIEIIEPSELSYGFGEKMELRVRVTDFGDEPVNDAAVKALVNNSTEIVFELTKIGTYSAFYEVQQDDAGEIKIDFIASDTFGNEGLKSASVSVSGKGFFYDVSSNMAVFGAVIILFVLAGTIGLVFLRSKSTAKSLNKRIGGIEQRQKQAQEKYFHEHSISREEYQKLMETYENELKNAKSGLEGQGKK